MRTQMKYLLLGVLAATLAAHSAGVLTDDDNCTGCAQALQTLFANVTVALPATPFEQNGFHGWVNDTECTNFKFGHVGVLEGPGQVDPATGKVVSREIQINLDGIALYCHGYVHYARRIIKGKMQMTASGQKLGITTSVVLGFNEDGIPNSVTAGDCIGADLSLEVKLKGKVVATLADWIIPFLKGRIEKTIKEQVCDKKAGLPFIINGDMNDLVENTSALATHYYNTPPRVANPPVFPAPAADLVHWQDLAPLLAMAESLLKENSSSGLPLIPTIATFLAHNDTLSAQVNHTFSTGDLYLLQANVSLDTAWVQGLDTLRFEKLLRPVREALAPGYDGAFSLETAVSLGRLRWNASGRVRVLPGSGVPRGKLIETEFSVEQEVRDVRVGVVVQLVLNRTVLTATPLGNLLRQPAGCAAAAVESVHIDFLDMEVRQIGRFQFEGFAGMAPLMNEFSQIGHDVFGNRLVNIARGFIADNVELTDRFFSDTLAQMKMQGCPHWSRAEDIAPDALIDFTQNPVMLALTDLAKNFGFPSPLGYSVNEAIDAISNSKGEVVLAENTLLTTDLLDSIGISTAGVAVSDLTLSQYDAVYQMDVLKDVSNYSFGTAVSFGGPAPQQKVQLSAQLNTFAGGRGVNAGRGLNGTFRLALGLQNVTFASGVTAKVLQKNLYDMTVQKALDVLHLCPLSIFDTLAVHQTLIHIGAVDLNVTCVECRSQQMEVFSEMLADPESIAQLTDTVNFVNGFLAREEVLVLVNGILAQLVHNASYMCKEQLEPSVDPFPPLHKSPNLGVYLGIPLELWLVIATAFFSGCIYTVFRVNKFLARKSGSPLVFQRVQSLQRTLHDDEADASLEDALLHKTSQKVDFMAEHSIFSHPRVPKMLSLFLSVVLIVSIAIQVIATVSTLQVFCAKIMVAGNEIMVRDIDHTTPMQVFLDMFDAGIYPLAFTLLLLSGNFPTLRATLLLVSIYISPKSVSSDFRGSMIHWLNILGKWSLPTMYVYFLVNLALRQTIFLEEKFPFMPKDFVVIDVFVRTAFSLVGQLITFITVGVVNQVLLVIQNDLWNLNPVLPNKTASSALGLPIPSSRGAVRVTVLGNVLVFSGIAGAIACTALGFYYTNFYYRFSALAGAAMDTAAYREYTIFDVGASAHRDVHLLNSYFVNACFFAFTMVAPVVHLLLLLVLLYAPLTSVLRQRVWVAADFAKAWGSLEVYAVTSVLLVSEIRQFLLFKIGDDCDQLNDVLVYFEDSLPFHPTCFDFHSQVKPESAYVFAAAALSILMHYFTKKIARGTVINPESRLTALATSLGLIKFSDRDFYVSLDQEPPTDAGVAFTATNE